MYPAFHVGPLVISSFSTMMLVAFLVAAWLGTRQARFAGVDPNIAWHLLPWAAAAGVVGAKLYALLLVLPEWIRAGGPMPRLGEVWYGGLIAGTAVVTWRFRRLGHPVHLLYDFGVAPVALGHAIGRIGCFLVGDDYGRPTDLALGVAFPRGAPPTTAFNLRADGVSLDASIPDTQVMAVHPTQLYEAAALTIIGAWLWHASRRSHRRWTVFAQYLVLYGAWRFCIEFLRVKDDHFQWSALSMLTSAQVLSLIMVSCGTALLYRQRHAVT